MIILHVVTSFLLSITSPPAALANLIVLALLQCPYFTVSPSESLKSALAMLAPLVVIARLPEASTFYLCSLALHLTSAWFRMYQ